MDAMRHPHFHDRVNQEAAWQAVVNVSGVDFSPQHPWAPCPEGSPGRSVPFAKSPPPRTSSGNSLSDLIVKLALNPAMERRRSLGVSKAW